MSKIDHFYNIRCAENSDIFQHLPTLKEYASKCDVIVELGLRSIVSTWAFLAGRPKKMVSVDIFHPEYYLEYDNVCTLTELEAAAAEEGIEYEFIHKSSLEAEIPECDLLFFDTLHTFQQLSEELRLHGHKSRKYLIFHDTVTYVNELMPAIEWYISTDWRNNGWGVAELFTNNNGLLVIQKHLK